MPIYVYRCPVCGKEIEEVQSMVRIPQPLHCPIGCGYMVKKPQLFMVNWGGLKPSDGDIPVAVKKTIENAPSKRDNIQPHKSNRMIEIEKELGRND